MAANGADLKTQIAHSELHIMQEGAPNAFHRRSFLEIGLPSPVLDLPVQGKTLVGEGEDVEEVGLVEVGEELLPFKALDQGGGLCWGAELFGPAANFLEDGLDLFWLGDLEDSKGPN